MENHWKIKNNKILNNINTYNIINNIINNISIIY